MKDATTNSLPSKLEPVRRLDSCKQQAEAESSMDWNKTRDRWRVTTLTEEEHYKTKSMAETMLNCWRTRRMDDLFRGRGQNGGN